jgi:hypothetical protein
MQKMCYTAGNICNRNYMRNTVKKCRGKYMPSFFLTQNICHLWYTNKWDLLANNLVPEDNMSIVVLVTRWQKNLCLGACLGLLRSTFFSQIDAAPKLCSRQKVELWEHLKRCFRNSAPRWSLFSSPEQALNVKLVCNCFCENTVRDHKYARVDIIASGVKNAKSIWAFLWSLVVSQLN